ncbi:three-helix bundle dimerization domain-containing protein [Rhodococcus wratislaviensis]|uniref:three-helix bundle dimerization domain-containing protein n=1 Tax=Rhodococcus wratislaviensis TaxID=44752 RepID=UPI003513DAF1
MDVTEEQHIDAVRAHLIQRCQFLDTDQVEDAIETAHHRFDGCHIRDFVPVLVERAATRTLEESLTITPPATYPTVPRGAVTTGPGTPGSGGRRERHRQSRGVCRRHTKHRLHGSHPLSPARKGTARSGHQPHRMPEPKPRMGQSNTETGRPG